MNKAVITGALVAGMAASPALTASAMADERPDVTTVVSHEDEANVIPADPDCGLPMAVIETQEGTERLHIVEGEDHLHFVAGEAVWVTAVWEDGSPLDMPPRRITDAVVFHSVSGGHVIVFHESFHDRGTPWGHIAAQVTYVEVDGEVKVERFSGRNQPPEGC